jgi:N6-adenosine-specific RNA methylase IME4
VSDTLPTDSIQVGQRCRKDTGDLEQLKASINEIGLLHPIVIDESNTLIAGYRRLCAFRELSRTDIPVTRVNIENTIRGEADENSMRLDLRPSEAVALARALEPVEKQKAVERMSEGGKEGVENYHTLGKTRDKLGAMVGMSGKTLEKAFAVVESDDEDLIAKMDDKGSVNHAYTELKRREAREANRLIVERDQSTLTGKYHSIVLDPPWDWGDEGDKDQLGRGNPIYATMPLEQILELPVGNLAEDNAHIYLWTTNRSLPKGFKLLDAWGFRYITCITWCKESFGMGNYFRGQSEQVLFGVRGSLPLLRKDAGTWFTGKRGSQHSSKPEEFYQLVESCSPGPWLEMFARTARPGWTVWGAEV